MSGTATAANSLQQQQDSWLVKHRRVLALCGVVLCAAASIAPHFHAIDTCLVDRFSLPRRTPLTDLRIGTGILLHAFLVACTYPFPRSALPSHVRWGLAVVFFHAVYTVSAFVRELQGDYTCGHPGKANGISGHAMHYVYFALLCITADNTTTSNNRSRHCALEILRWLSVALCVAILVETLARGFHTVRQVLVGASLGVVLWCGVVEWSNAMRGRTALYAVLPLLGVFALGAFAVTRTTHLPFKTSDLFLLCCAVVAECLPLLIARCRQWQQKQD